ncbi:hypothetical protein EDB85DRAFT_127813 [Lactarius pseudohatsudake]|nr:hypothetical protein EDB85DRAFT_127813 [Lactarius pseudohatsudake]
MKIIVDHVDCEMSLRGPSDIVTIPTLILTFGRRCNMIQSLHSPSGCTTTMKRRARAPTNRPHLQRFSNQTFICSEMSSTQPSMSPSNFRLILDAFDHYASQVGIDLTKNPLADALRRCDSPNAVLELLQDKAHAFNGYRDGDRTLIDWLKPVVQVVHGFSGVLGQAVSLVSRQVPFPLASAVLVSVEVLLAAASDVSSSYDSLVDLFECLGNFLKRLQIYTSIPLTPLMTDIVVKILVELLSVLALATKQVQQGRLKKFGKKLLGESEIEAVLQKLDRLTQEEARVMAAQTLEVVHCLVSNVKVVMDDGRASLDGVRNILVTMQGMASEINKMKRPSTPCFMTLHHEA